MEVVLVVAEKPSIARGIADILHGSREPSPMRRSVVGMSCPPVYEFEGLFQSRRALFRVTSEVAGEEEAAVVVAEEEKGAEGTEEVCDSFKQ